MELNQLLCEVSALSFVDRILTKTRLKCQFSKETDSKKQVLGFFLDLLKESEENQDYIKKLSDERKRELIEFFGYGSLIQAESESELDRKNMILRSSLAFEINNGIYYFGDVDKDGVLNGEATITYGEHCIYEGAVKNGLPDGQGRIFSFSEKVSFYYEGTFEQGSPNGENTTVINNMQYEGTWNNGSMHGSMLTKNKDGNQVEIRFIIRFIIDQNKIPSFVVEEEKANYYDGSSFFNFLTKCNPLTSCIPKTAENIDDYEIRLKNSR